MISALRSHWRPGRRRRQAIERQLPGAIELLVLLVRTGLTPHLAIERICGHLDRPTADGFGAVVDRVRRGERLADALPALPATLGPGYARLADALALAERYGLPLDTTLDRLADDARAARRRLAEADARTLPVRLAFPLVTCCLPSFVLTAIAPAVVAAIGELSGPPL